MKYVRNPDIIKQNLITTKNGQIMTKVPCRIQVPSRFIDRGLGQIGIDTYVMGIFAIIDESNNYSVCNINALVELDPFKTITVTIDDVEYYEFHFKANSVVVKTTDLIRRNVLMYNIFDELVFKGKVPWYMSYEDMGKLFDTAKSHADSNIGETQEVIEFIASIITRSKQDRKNYIRTIAQSYKDVEADKIAYVPMMSVFYSINSTMNKISGSYFSDGITSSLVTPTEKISTVESILRT